MKAILLSIKPKYVSMILNQNKTIEIRRRFPKDFVGWVYIYCCKQQRNEIGCHINYKKVDGKVVARFWCDNVEEIGYEYRYDFESFYTDELDTDELLKASCLTKKEMRYYLDTEIGYAIHISDLEIFDKPKELCEFKHFVWLRDEYISPNPVCDMCKFPNCKKCERHYCLVPLTKAPQNYMFIEIEE